MQQGPSCLRYVNYRVSMCIKPPARTLCRECVSQKDNGGWTKQCARSHSQPAAQPAPMPGCFAAPESLCFPYVYARRRIDSRPVAVIFPSAEPPSGRMETPPTLPANGGQRAKMGGTAQEDVSRNRGILERTSRPSVSQFKPLSSDWPWSSSKASRASGESLGSARWQCFGIGGSERQWVETTCQVPAVTFED